MKKHHRTIASITITILLIITYWLYGNSYTQLKPIQVQDSKMVIIPLTTPMLRNFPEVLKYYHIPYKTNDSGLLTIPLKYARDRDLVLTMTNITLDTAQMKKIRSKH